MKGGAATGPASQLSLGAALAAAVAVTPPLVSLGRARRANRHRAPSLAVEFKDAPRLSSEERFVSHASSSHAPRQHHPTIARGTCHHGEYRCHHALDCFRRKPVVLQWDIRAQWRLRRRSTWAYPRQRIKKRERRLYRRRVLDDKLWLHWSNRRMWWQSRHL